MHHPCSRAVQAIGIKTRRRLVACAGSSYVVSASHMALPISCSANVVRVPPIECRRFCCGGADSYALSCYVMLTQAQDEEAQDSQAQKVRAYAS